MALYENIQFHRKRLNMSQEASNSNLKNLRKKAEY